MKLPASYRSAIEHHVVRKELEPIFMSAEQPLPRTDKPGKSIGLIASIEPLLSRQLWLLWFQFHSASIPSWVGTRFLGRNFYLDVVGPLQLHYTRLVWVMLPFILPTLMDFLIQVRLNGQKLNGDIKQSLFWEFISIKNYTPELQSVRLTLDLAWVDPTLLSEGEVWEWQIQCLITIVYLKLWLDWIFIPSIYLAILPSKKVGFQTNFVFSTQIDQMALGLACKVGGLSRCNYRMTIAIDCWFESWLDDSIMLLSTVHELIICNRFEGNIVICMSAVNVINETDDVSTLMSERDLSRQTFRHQDSRSKMESIPCRTALLSRRSNVVDCPNITKRFLLYTKSIPVQFVPVLPMNSSWWKSLEDCIANTSSRPNSDGWEEVHWGLKSPWNWRWCLDGHTVLCWSWRPWGTGHSWIFRMTSDRMILMTLMMNFPVQWSSV